MSLVDESLSAAIDFLLASDGTVVGVGPTRGAVDVTPELGKPLAETYWFRHSDSDERDLWNLLREASRGKADRLRVWVRVSEHQLVRCDLLVTPILGPGGEVLQIVARTEPTPSAPRRRGMIEPIVKAISTQAQSTDAFHWPLALPMLRLDVESGLIADVNNPLLEFLEIERDRLPARFDELVEPSHRGPVLESISQARSDGIGRTIQSRLLRKTVFIEVELSIAFDQNDKESAIALVALSDRSAEQRARELSERAEQLAALSIQQDSTLRNLQRLIEACPTPIGVIENGQLSHASPSLRERVDADTLSALLANRRSDADSSVVMLDEQKSIYGVIGAVPVGMNAFDGSALLGVATIDVHGRISNWNALFARWAGATDAKPRGLFESLDTDSRLALEIMLRKIEAEPQTVTLRFKHTGVICRCEVSQAGNAFVLAAIDQTDLQRSLDEIERALASERRLLDSLPMRLIRLDANGKLFWANRAASALDLSELEPLINEKSHDANDENLLLNDGLQLHPIERSASGTAFALVDQRNDREVRRKSSRMNAIESLINSDPPLALLELDLPTGVTTANAAAREMLKLGEECPIVLAELASPADRATVQRAFYGGSDADKERIDFEFHLDSTGQRLRVVGQVFFDQENGATVPWGAVARLIDVEKDVLPSIERNPITTALFESIEGAVRIYTSQTARRNGAAIRLFGIEEADWRDVSAWRSRFDPRDADGKPVTLLPAEMAMRGEAMTLEMTIQTAQGERRVRESAMPIYFDQQIVGCVCIDLDLTEQTELQRRIEWLESKVSEQSSALRDSSVKVDELALELESARCDWINQLPTPAMRLDLNGRLIDANPLVWKLLEIEPVEAPLEKFNWFDAQDRSLSSSDLLALFRRDDSQMIALHARHAGRAQSMWLEIFRLTRGETITLLLRDRSREMSMMASMSQLQTRINEISAEAESRRLRMIGDHHALVTLIQMMCADVDLVAQPLALDRRLPADAHALARGVADVVSLAHRILEAAVDRPRAIELSVGVRRRSDLVQLTREAIRLIGPLSTRLAREIMLNTEAAEAIADVEPALARHSIVAALLSAIGNTPARAPVEVNLQPADGSVQLEIRCPSAAPMKKTGLMQQFADALARATNASLEYPDGEGRCWGARFQLAADASSARPVSTRPRCVLLVEDHESTSRVISRQLARVGCVVRTVRGAGEARLAVRESSDIDLILCDMSLPDGDPLELMTDLSRQFGLRGVALGVGNEIDLQNLRDAGFTERLAKPVDLVLLANVINHVVDLPRGEMENSR